MAVPRRVSGSLICAVNEHTAQHVWKGNHPEVTHVWIKLVDSCSIISHQDGKENSLFEYHRGKISPHLS